MLCFPKVIPVSRQYISGSCFFIESDKLCVLVRIFTQFIFNAVINIIWLISITFVFVFYLSHLLLILSYSFFLPHSRLYFMIPFYLCYWLSLIYIKCKCYSSNILCYIYKYVSINFSSYVVLYVYFIQHYIEAYLRDIVGFILDYCTKANTTVKHIKWIFWFSNEYKGYVYTLL